MKFNDEHMRKMSEEDKHNIKDYESVRTLVWKLELQMVVLKERKEGSASGTAPASSGGGTAEGSTQAYRRGLGMVAAHLGPDWTGTGWDEKTGAPWDGRPLGMDEVMPMRCLGPSPCRDQNAKGVGR